MNKWYKNDELELDLSLPSIVKPAIEDVLIMEPSRQDRNFSNSSAEMVERTWILTRPPPGLYIRQPTVTGREVEVARMAILSGQGLGDIVLSSKWCVEKPSLDSSKPRGSGVRRKSSSMSNQAQQPAEPQRRSQEDAERTSQEETHIFLSYE